MAAFAMPTPSEALFGTSTKDAAKKLAEGLTKHVKGASPAKAKEILCRKGDVSSLKISFRSFNGVLGSVPGVAQVAVMLCKNEEGFADSKFMEKYNDKFGDEDPKEYLLKNGAKAAKDSVTKVVMPTMCGVKDAFPSPIPVVMDGVCAAAG